MAQPQKTYFRSFSPTDLVLYLTSPYVCWMTHYSRIFPGKIECDPEDGQLALLKAEGTRHEERFLRQLVTDGLSVFTIPKEGKFEDRFAETVRGMKKGEQVIYQAGLEDSPMRGYADFLFRIEKPSKLGSWSYEAWDTKLARKPKPDYVIQLCAYSEMLGALQGYLPEHFVVVLGDQSRKSFRTNDYFDFYKALKRRFTEFLKSFDPSEFPLPKKYEETDPWTTYTERVLKEKDSLLQVAGITDSQILKLATADIKTMTELSKSKLSRIPRLDSEIFARLKHQASLQVRTTREKKPVCEVLPHNSEIWRGLCRLPPASEGDVFFDMEGYPIVDGGLEYLFGACTFEKGKSQFHDWWAHSEGEEQKAFEGFVDWAYARWKKFPDMHIYHYAAYEVTALRRLMGKFASREEEIDELLRHNVLVDLYAIVRHAIRVGEPSYSIKYLEKFYALKRQSAVKVAGDSVVMFGRWLDDPDGKSWKESKVLMAIRQYNLEDCESTIGLTHWLRKLQTSPELHYRNPQLSKKQTDKAEEEEPAVTNEGAVLARLFLNGEIFPPEDAPAGREAVETLGYLIEYHRREAKPFWWAFFARQGMTTEELSEDRECLGGLVRTESEPVPEKRSMLFEYRFDPGQETKIRPSSTSGGVGLIQFLNTAITVHSIDPDRGVVQIKISRPALSEMGGEPPNETAIVPTNPVSNAILEASIRRIAGECQQRRNMEPVSPAFRRLLLRKVPRVAGMTEGHPLVKEDEDDVDAVVRIGLRMEESTLCIQGPPGTGKTYAGAKLILALLESGKRIGVTANSHDAIWNLLLKVKELAPNSNDKYSICKVESEPREDYFAHTGFSHEKSGRAAWAAGYKLIGGTAWTFSNEEAVGQLDHLIVDEAGQCSLANLAAMSSSARNIVLLGDQMQLDQVTQGSHPGKSSLSCLSYYLEDHATIPPERGIFLHLTRRMRPEICSFISETVYEERLKSHPSTSNRELVIKGEIPLMRHNSGINFVAVEHKGNSQLSSEEVEVIKSLFEDLLKASIRDGKSKRRLQSEDILVVAPFNVQVNALKNCLSEGVRVGTVDRFQGQEAPVVIVSMTSSTIDDAPRGLKFLLNLNRLNVAVSRAQCLAVVVGSPKLTDYRPRTHEDIKLLNTYCRLVTL